MIFFSSQKCRWLGCLSCLLPGMSYVQGKCGPSENSNDFAIYTYRLKGSGQRNSKARMVLVSSCFPQRSFRDHMHASVYLSKALLVGPDKRKRGGCCQMCSGRQVPRKPWMGFQESLGRAKNNPGHSRFPSQTTEPWGKDTTTNKGAL